MTRTPLTAVLFAALLGIWVGTPFAKKTAKRTTRKVAK